MRRVCQCSYGWHCIIGTWLLQAQSLITHPAAGREAKQVNMVTRKLACIPTQLRPMIVGRHN